MRTVEFYDDALTARLKKKYRIAWTVTCVLAAATLVSVLILLFTVNTANEKRNEATAILINALGGCAALAVWVNAVLPTGRLIAHVKNVREGERAAFRFEARPVIAGKIAQIPHSIEIYRVSVKNEEETTVLFIERSLCKRLSDLPESGVFYTVNRYVVAVGMGGDER